MLLTVLQQWRRKISVNPKPGWIGLKDSGIYTSQISVNCRSQNWRGDVPLCEAHSGCQYHSRAQLTPQNLLTKTSMEWKASEIDLRCVSFELEWSRLKTNQDRGSSEGEIASSFQKCSANHRLSGTRDVGAGELRWISGAADDALEEAPSDRHQSVWYTFRNITFPRLARVNNFQSRHPRSQTTVKFSIAMWASTQTKAVSYMPMDIYQRSWHRGLLTKLERSFLSNTQKQDIPFYTFSCGIKCIFFQECKHAWLTNISEFTPPACQSYWLHFNGIRN